jgi:hypothetical protein
MSLSLIILADEAYKDDADFRTFAANCFIRLSAPFFNPSDHS